MEYYNIGQKKEINNQIDYAKFYYHLSVILGYDLGLKKLEYLENNVVKYLCKYHNKSFNEDFLHLIMYWFDIKVKNITTNFEKEMKPAHVSQCWINTWFAKNTNQIRVDNELKIFEEMYNKYKNYDPTYLYEYVALIILYDQIPRNIYRNTEKAYQTDSIAFKYAKFLSQFIDYLPLHVNIFVILSYCHQESVESHQECKLLIKKIVTKYSDFEIIKSLESIFYNHYDRIMLFGRIPERNNILNRKSSEQENIYMNNL